MDMLSILDRITKRIETLETSERAVSLSATKSPDTIRNWRRKSETGEESGATLLKLSAVAAALGMTPRELIFGEEATTAAAGAGFSDHVTPYIFSEQPTADTEPQAGLRRIFGPRARSPATLQANRDYPGLNISRGDVVVMDLSRLPKPGELCALRIEDDNGNSTTDFRRYLPPYLVEDGAGFSSEPLSVDDPRLTIRNPIIGLLRGLPEAS